MTNTNQSVAELAGDHLSVKMFGATGDGSTDDTAALNAALNYCFALGTARDLRLPAGVYRTTAELTAQLRFTADQRHINGVRLFGEGPQSQIYNTGATNGALRVIGSLNYDDFFIANLRIRTNTSGISDFGLKLQTINGFRMDDIVVEGVDPSTGGYLTKTAKGIWLNGAEMGVVTQTSIRFCNKGFHLDYGTSFPGGGGNAAVNLLGGMVQSCTGADGTAFNILEGDLLKIQGFHALNNPYGMYFPVPSLAIPGNPNYYNDYHNVEVSNMHFESSPICSVQIGSGATPYTTIAASIATGSQVVTPASMPDGMVVGREIFIANANGTNAEFVIITAVTTSTFTAVFASTKTGPGIQIFMKFGNVTPGPLTIRHCSFYEGNGGHAIDNSGFGVRIRDNFMSGNVNNSGDVIIRPVAERTRIGGNTMYSSPYITNSSLRGTYFTEDNFSPITGAAIPPSGVRLTDL